MMKSVKIWILATTCLVGVLCFSSVHAEEITLTWQDCLGKIQVNNPTYLEALTVLEQAKQDQTIAYSGLYPQLSLGASARKSSDQTNLSDPASSSASLSFKQLLFDGWNTSASAQSADLKWQQAQINFQTTAASLRLSARQAYLELLKSRELVALTQSIENQRRQNLNLVKLRYNGGREHIGSLKSAEANLAQAQFESNQALRSTLLAQQQLAQIIGLPLDQTLTSPESLVTETPSVSDPNFKQLVESSPQYRAAQFNRDIAEKKLVQAYSDYYPSLNLNASTGVSSQDWIPDHADWSASLSLNFNVFDGGSRGAQLAKTKSALKQTELALRSTYENDWLALASQWKTLQDLQETVSVKQKYLEATMARSKIANAQYSNGLLSFVDWSSIEDALVSARKSYLDSQANLTLAYAKW